VHDGIGSHLHEKGGSGLRFVRLQAWGKNEHLRVYLLVLFKLSYSKETTYNALPVRMD
jgi:hypothetical protein